MPSHGTRSVPATIALAPRAARRDRGLERTSPSALEGGALLRAANVLRAKSAGALGTGTLIHAWLEQIEWLDDGLPSDEELRQIAAQTAGRNRRRLRAAGRAGRPLSPAARSPDIAAVLHRSYYAQHAADELRVSRERKFAVRTGDELLGGSIDRLVVLRQGGRPDRR